MSKRSYKMSKRADAQAETRQRIVDAVVALHQELGPKATTISAIAEKAGVQRLTVYRHFPDDMALFAACTAEWAAANPRPDPASWQCLKDGASCTRAALEALYDYYAGTADMWRKSFRDAPDVPALDQPMAAFQQYLTDIRTNLCASLDPGNVALERTLDHLLAFPTWESLHALCGSPREAVALAMSWIDAQGKK